MLFLRRAGGSPHPLGRLASIKPTNLMATNLASYKRSAFSQQISTYIDVSSPPNPSTYGSSVTLTATWPPATISDNFIQNVRKESSRRAGREYCRNHPLYQVSARRLASPTFIQSRK
jgi:hypothetical protein